MTWTWLFVALAVLTAIVVAGRAHSRYLDAQEARWMNGHPEGEPSDSVVTDWSAKPPRGGQTWIVSNRPDSIDPCSSIRPGA